MSVGIKVADRQGFHIVEHVITQGFDGTLTDKGHDLVIDGVGNKTQGVDGAHGDDDGHQLVGHGRHTGRDARQYDFIDQPLHEGGGDDRGQGGDDQTDADTGQLDFIAGKDVLEQAQKRLRVDLLVGNITSSWRH